MENGYVADAPGQDSTARLALEPVTIDDLQPVSALHADPRLWSHYPSGRHTSIDQTRDFVLRCEQQWHADGLAYWIARLRCPVGALEVGDVAGMGGCGRPPEQSWWNLYYRLRPEAHQHGLAAELARAAVRAAHRVAVDRPVIARVLEHNDASVRTAERAGLTLAWRGPAAENPSVTRLIFTDRAVSDELLDSLKTRT